MDTEKIEKVKSDKHITIRGKPICRCHFSKEQFVKLVAMIQDRWTCTYDSEDPKLKLVFDSIKSVVKDPATVEIKDGSCTSNGPVPFVSMMKIPPGATQAQIGQLIAAQLGCAPDPSSPSGHNRLSFTPGGVIPGGTPPTPTPPTSSPPEDPDDSDSFAA